jgi:cytochrome c oxidase subunit 2
MNNNGAIFMPPAASTYAHEVDSAYMLINIICVFFFCLVIGLMTYFVIRYRRRGSADLTPNIAHNTPLEVIWTVIPVILVVIIFFVGFRGYMNQRVAPQNSMQVNLTARRWMWTFDYGNGVKSNKTLAVPAGKPVQMIMNSEDVIHAFYVPDFRIKQDVVPNRYTMVWFQADQPGTHTLFCAEYCGASHSNMMADVVVMPQDQFDEWLQSGGVGDIKGLPLAKQGEILYTAKACNTCHSLDGSASTGPTWKGLFGHNVSFTDGSTAQVDSNYIRESIMTPQARIVQGFSPVMPTYQGQLDDAQITAIIEYIKTLK